ncbi:MAG: O-antigen ligase family protein [Acidimicrobiia bacterium]
MFLLFVCPSPYVVVALGGSASPAMLVGLAMFVWWGLSRVTSSLSAAHTKQPIRIAAYFFIATILASIAAAYARVLPAQESQATLRGLAIALSFIGVVLFFADGLKDRNDVEKIVKAFIIGGSFVAVIGLLQFITRNNIAPMLKLPGLGAVNDITFISERNGLPRVSGTAYHPIEYAVVLCAIWPFALRNAVMNWTKSGRIVSLIPFILITCALPTALSRTAVVAFGAIVATMFFTWTTKRRSRFFLTSALCIVCLFIFAPKLPNVLIELFTKANQDVSISTRTSDYSQASKEIQNHLFFGRGYKTYDPNTYIYLDNQFLLSLIETGIFGLLSILGIFGTAITLGRNIKHKARDRFVKELGQCCASSLFAILLCFATFDTLSFPMISFVSASIIGITSALWRINRYINGQEEMAFHLTTSRVIEKKPITLVN